MNGLLRSVRRILVILTKELIQLRRDRTTLGMVVMIPLIQIELMLGKIVPYIGIGIVQTTLILVLGHLIFAVPLDGALAATTLAFISASLALGLVLSTIATSQLQAMQMTVFILLPSILLSGFMFPYEGMPVPAQYIAEALPVTHFMRTIRAVVLRGAGLPEVAFDTLWLVVLPDNESLPPVGGDARCEPLQGHAPSQRRVHAIGQPFARARRPPVSVAFQGDGSRARSTWALSRSSNVCRR
jgi:hypothetical protein